MAKRRGPTPRRAAAAAAPAPPAAAALPERFQPLDRLRQIALQRRLLDEDQRLQVALARDGGASWADIGRALGRTARAVSMRYGGSTHVT